MAVLRAGARAGDALHRQADLHVAGCADCQAAAFAAAVLDAERSVAVPEPPQGAAARAIRAAQRADEAPAAGKHTFVKGMLAGAAIAAGLALAVTFVRPDAPSVAPAATPLITMALNETRAISIGLDTPEAMTGAEIRVLVSGDVALDGYAGQRELRWRTDLSTGSNQLTIPVVATGPAGGQLLVEVEHEMKRRRFLVDIESAG